MQRFYVSARARVGVALATATAASIGLYIAGALSNHNREFAYLPWNLSLAWVPLLLSLWLERVLHARAWSSWYALVVSAVWVIFLPNAFYMISDFVHIHDVGRVDLLYDVVMFTSFIFTAALLGFLSLALVHGQLVRRMSARLAWSMVLGILLLCSFAIYIGRELRWNSWDILASPASLLFDVSDRLLNIGNHPEVFNTTASFFVLLSTIYAVLWFVLRTPRQQDAP